MFTAFRAINSFIFSITKISKKVYYKGYFYQHVSSVDLIYERNFIFDSLDFCIFQDKCGETTFLFIFSLLLGIGISKFF